MLKKMMLFLVISSLTFAHNTGAFKLGFFNPSATEGGFIIGYEGWRVIDRNFSIGWSVDWFNKNYVDKNLVREFDNFFGVPNSELNELRAKTNLHSVPIMFTATGSFSVAPRTNFYITGGAGAEVLLIFYNNYVNPNEDDFHAAFDFNWRIGFGVAHELGRRSDIIAEVTYHNSEPSWTFDVDDPNSSRKRTFERSFDMSGIMMRVGMRFYF